MKDLPATILAGSRTDSYKTRKKSTAGRSKTNSFDKSAICIKRAEDNAYKHAGGKGRFPFVASNTLRGKYHIQEWSRKVAE